MDEEVKPNWYDIFEKISIRVSMAGAPFRLDFYDYESVEDIPPSKDKKRLKEGEKISTHINQKKGFLGRSRHSGIRKRLTKSTLSIKKGEADDIINKFGMQAEKDLQHMLEALYGETEDEEEEDVDEERLERIDKEAERILESPELLVRIDDAIHQDMALEHRNALMCFTSCISTLTEEPINLRWSGRSSTGKSHIVVTVTNVLPDEMVIMYIGMTEKSLFYDPNAEQISETEAEIELKGKILVILEESNAQEFLEAAKPVLSHDRWEHPYGYTDTSGASPVRKTISLVGWPAYVGLSVDPEENIELGTRELTAMPEIGQEKYGAVIDWKALKKFAFKNDRDSELVEVIKQAVRKLDEYKIWNPFLPIIRSRFPNKLARQQRDWDKVVAAVEAVTLLHQKQRDVVDIEGEPHLVSTPFDNLVAIEMFKWSLWISMMNLDMDAIKFHQHLMRVADDYGEKEGSRKAWDGQDELVEEYVNCFGETINRTTLKERYIDQLEEHRGLEVRDKPDDNRMNRYMVKPIGGEKDPNLEKKMSRTLNLPEIRDLLLDFDYNEDNLNKLCRRAEVMSETKKNPGVEWMVESNGTPTSQGARLHNFYELKDRFTKSEEEERVDWESEVLDIFYEESDGEYGSDETEPEGDEKDRESGYDEDERERKVQKCMREIEQTLKFQALEYGDLYDKVSTDDMAIYNDALERLRGDVIGKVKGDKFAHRDNVSGWKNG